MIKGITFPNQLIPAEAEGAALAACLSDGILRGCTISYSGRTLTIGPGHMIVAGRVIEITAAEGVNVAATSGYARIKARIDTGLASTADATQQISITVDTAGSENGFAALGQGDVNGGSGAVYEAEICKVSLGGLGITGILRRMGRAAARGVVWLDSDPGAGAAVPYADGVILAIS